MTKGSSMTFDVNEKFYFERGQGISQMVSISLDPDILVQEYNDYVQIRGLIILQGDYEKVTGDHVGGGDRLNPLNKYIEKVVDEGTDHAHFSHRIPVDITVPKERVSNPENITVTFDSFDYELPTPYILEVLASLKINGLKDLQLHREEEPLVTHNEHNNVKPVTSTEEIEKTDEVTDDDVLQVKQDGLIEDRAAAISSEKQTDNREPIQTSDQTNVIETVQTDDQTNVIETVQTEQQVDMKKDEAEKETVLEEEEKVLSVQTAKNVQNKPKDLTSEHDNGDDSEQIVDASSEHNIDIQLKEAAPEVESEEEEKEVLFLTDYFADEAEETYTTWRIHITQEDDTIESIAERYEIPTLQLIKDNGLSDHTLETGQLLTISSQVQESQD